MSINVSSFTNILSSPTHFFGLKLWIIIIIFIGILIMILLFASFCSYYCRCPRRRKKKLTRGVSDRKSLSRRGWDQQMAYSSRSNWSQSDFHVVDMETVVFGSARLCKNYSAREIEVATDGFNVGSVVARGEYGVVYCGILLDGRRVAVKELLSSSANVGEFIEEVEAIWCIKHKNLVKLLGYSIEGAKRMLVYEYVNNGNLHQWLHGCRAKISPLTWDIRMSIILGITKGLVYLHEDSEPIVIHRNLKSSSILLDHKWNPRISNVGITKLLGLEQNQSIAGGTLGGYIAPEYVLTHSFDEKSDIYSFGVLIMEIISGRTAVEYAEFGIKEYLVDWLKSKVGDQKFDDIVDQRLPELPSSKELKRIILIALRCVDPDVENRPTIGDVIYMLEPHDLLLDDITSQEYGFHYFLRYHIILVLKW
ncbi:Protein kinase, catalytic domain-containing protein [Artemisia annua]|uniref:non-specific serine/threonine protein kinase n=1 Tax=Artemisia annua TaxID=35608 RepID=A0A2U1P9D0_ARTAN|nr:Protein kinase, catalytic domain-containing protein [Artemisia annua]